MKHEILSYFSLAYPLCMDALLVGAALLFIVRLYLVERRFEEGLIVFEREYLKTKLNTNFIPFPEEEWFLAHHLVYPAVTTSQYRRLDKLRKIARFIFVTLMSLASLFGVSALWAATSTGSLTVSAIVLSRCLIRFPAADGKVESVCTDGVNATKSIGEQGINQPVVSSAAVDAVLDTTGGQSRGNQPITTVTLTY